MLKVTYLRPLRRSQAGATLMEVLVSFLIVSFGLLAMLAMQNAALQFNKTSEMRSVATMLANDIGDRMKANIASALAGNYDLTSAYSPSQNVPARTPCATTTSCTTTELATQDLGEWLRTLYFSLPGSDAYLVANTANRAVDLWIAWRDPNNSDDPIADNGNKKECPTGFVASTVTPKPRCMYFRIALPN